MASVDGPGPSSKVSAARGEPDGPRLSTGPNSGEPGRNAAHAPAAPATTRPAAARRLRREAVAAAASMATSRATTRRMVRFLVIGSVIYVRI